MTARVQDLVELKYLAIDAKHLGFIVNGNEGNFDALTATGNNSQANAYQIIANVNQFTTVTSTNNSCKLPQALGIPNGEYIIRNADSADNLYLFPFLGDSFNELATNTAITIFPGVTVSAQKIDATKWIVTSGTGGGSSSGTNTGDVTLAGTPNYITIAGQVITRALINLVNHVTGVLPEANGGTNQSSYAQGDIIYASAANTLAKLGKDTTATRYLTNKGTSNNPKWDVITLTDGVTGTLPVANGGTGATTFTPATYSPTYGGTGSMTFTTVTSTYTKFVQFGKMVHLWIHATGTTGGTANNTITISLPVTAATSAVIAGGGYVIDTATSAPQVFMQSTTLLGIKKNDGSNFALGASRTVYTYVCYEAA